MFRTFQNVETQVALFPIDEGSFGIYEQLLSLPHDLFKPIMDLLMDGVISYEDLVDTYRSSSSAANLALASDRVAEATRNSGEYTVEALLNRLSMLFAGHPSTVMIHDWDISAIGTDNSPEPYGGSYVPTPIGIVSPNLEAIIPNPIQLLRAGNNAKIAKLDIINNYLTPDVGVE